MKEFNLRHQLHAGRTSPLSALSTHLNPFSRLGFWRCLWFRVSQPSRLGWLGKLSAKTSLVFLLDPAASCVWPHPRTAHKKDAGTIAAHWILRLQNPRLKARAIPGLDAKTSSETLEEFSRELDWRYQMFQAYGDKFPHKLNSYTPETQSAVCVASLTNSSTVQS